MPLRSKLKVFVAEDSVNLQIALTDLVAATAQGEVVATAPSETKAVEWAVTHPGAWDLAIVDLMLTDGDGFNIIRRLKAQPDAGLVIVYSAFVTDVIQRHCLAIGADAVFAKTDIRKLAEYLESLAEA